MKLLSRAWLRRTLAIALAAVAPFALAASNSSAPAPLRVDAKATHVEELRAKSGAVPVRHLQLGMADEAAIEKAKRGNTRTQMKKLQIGIGREVPGYPEASSASLRWAAVAGGMASHWEVSSPGARALRVGLRADRMTPGVEVRFAGVGAPGTVYGPFTAAELLATGETWWSPVLQGERATVEVFVPAGGAPADAGLAIVMVSHLFANPMDKDVDKQAKDGSQFCEHDIACYASDAALVNTGKAVARMTFSDGSGGPTFLCSGTLLNPTDGSHTPYFYSANHCISTQASANTLTTYWFYDRTACDSGVTSASYTQVGGGAAIMYANESSDVLLLRLNNPPPAGAWYAGWDSTTVSTGTALKAIHHPAGDWKKVSLATMGGFGSPGNPSGSFIRSNWNSISTGVTEGGSSGSGIFTAVGQPATDYRLRGGLWGGPSTCGAVPGDLYDYYSRFDQAYAFIAQYLNPVVAVPGTLAFTASSLSVVEGVGSAVLSVSRTDGASGTVGLTYMTIDGTAFSGLDYGGGVNTLSWGPGDASTKSIVIPIYADGVTEPLETFSVMLMSPTGGATIGSPSTATVSIVDPGVFPPGGAVPAGWVQSPGANFAWDVATDSASEGTYSLKSGLPPNTNAYHGQRADIEVTTSTGAGNVTFWRRVSSQPGGDGLRFYVDGVEKGVWSGEWGWSEVSIPVDQGYHTLRWSYQKDGSIDGGFDTAWIDAVTLPPLGLDPAADLDGDGIPNGVEVSEWRNPFAKDNDVFSPGLASARLFAMQQYRDFLAREGEAAGVANWATLVLSGSFSRAQVIDAFFNSAEFGGIVAPVVRLYFAFFNRVPDYPGLAVNVSLLRQGLTLQAMADYFATSPEFLAAYGGLDDTQYVTFLYQNVLGRSPDPAGLAGWVSLLGSGYTRGQVMLGFSESGEYVAATQKQVYVTMMYAGMLRRTPEQVGYDSWIAYLVAGNPALQMVNGFFYSAEYHDRFLP